MTVATNFLKGANGTTLTKREIVTERASQAIQATRKFSPKDHVRLEAAQYAIDRAYREMSDALAEGDLGQAFRAFRRDNPKGAYWVIKCALVFWGISLHNRANRASMDEKDYSDIMLGIGAFAHNYSEMVMNAAELYLPLISPASGRAAHIAWSVDAWNVWAQNMTPATKL